jgi:hypothetical protein
MLDRRARDDINRALRAYMAEELTAFQLDDVLMRVMDETEDETVKPVALAIWCHYDDLKDHKIVATKAQWDYLNRLLLILESDAEIETVKTSWRWHGGQAVAAAFLMAFGCVALWAGFGERLLLYAVPFGLVSMVLARFNHRQRCRRVSASELALTPFPSVGRLLSVRRSVRGFVRRRYPREINGRRIRSPAMSTMIRLPSALAWLVLSPVVLFFQMLPERESGTRIYLPEERAEHGNA